MFSNIELLIVLIVIGLPILLIILVLKRTRFKDWLMRKSEARSFPEDEPKE